MELFHTTKLENKLSRSEKDLMKAAVLHTKVPSRYYSLLRHTLVPIALFIMLPLITFSSLMVSAENAIPGDNLYSIKTNVNERIAEVLSVSDTAKARHTVTVLGRRLDEVKKVIQSDTLEPEEQKVAIAALQEKTTLLHTESAQQIDELAAQGKEGEAIALSAQLQSSYSDAAETIDDAVAGDPSIAPVVGVLQTQIIQQEEATEETTQDVIQATVDNPSDDVHAEVKTLIEQIESKQENYQNKRENEDVQAHEAYKDAEQFYAQSVDSKKEGDKFMSDGNTEQALSAYTDALRAINRIDDILP